VRADAVATLVAKDVGEECVEGKMLGTLLAVEAKLGNTTWIKRETERERERERDREMGGGGWGGGQGRGGWGG
jgi:hypothetical protein